MKSKLNCKFQISVTVFLLQAILATAQNILLPTQQIVAYSVVVHPDSLITKKDGNAPAITSIDVHPNNFSEIVRNGLLNSEINNYFSPLSEPDFFSPTFKLQSLTHEQLLEMGRVEKMDNDTIIVIEPGWKTLIPEFRFIESWAIDEQKNTFEKNVICLLPIDHCTWYGELRRNQVCAIPFNYSEKELKNIRKSAVLSKRIKYEYSFWGIGQNCESNCEVVNDDAPFMNSIIRNRLIDFIFENAKSQKIVPYNFQNNQPISNDELKSILEDKQTFTFESSPGIYTDSTITVSYKNDEIQSLYFIEDWYISKKPFMVFKEVIGIAPVRHQWDSNTGLIRKTVPFTIYFDEKKRF